MRLNQARALMRVWACTHQGVSRAGIFDLVGWIESGSSHLQIVFNPVMNS